MVVHKGMQDWLVRADGQAMARHRGLSAVDATGRELPMRLEAQGRQVLLCVDDRGAHYPGVRVSGSAGRLARAGRIAATRRGVAPAAGRCRR